MSTRSKNANRGAVAAGHKLTAEAAADVLRAGGTAVDAVIAALWMACVCEPVLASPGGGGFMMIGGQGQPPQLLDFFVHTPKRKPAVDDLDCLAIEADFGTTRQEFHIGLGTSAVPGFVPGLFAAHRAHGRMPMRELAAPAVAAARAGVSMTAFQARLFAIVAPILMHEPGTRTVFAPSGKLLQEEECLANGALAEAIEAISHEGERLAVEGEIAAAMAGDGASGSALTRGDISNYRCERREPIRVEHRAAHFFLNPPPSCGGTLIAAMLGELGEKPVACDAPLLARAMQSVDDDWRRAERQLEAFASIPISTVRRRGTTHVSIIDAAGMAVSATVSNGEGNGHMVPGCGFMVNNMLGEDDLNPQGLHSWPVDMRLSSMMAPTLMQTGDGALSAFGSGGSNRIRTALFQVAARLCRAPQGDLQVLANAPRLHVEDGHLHFEDQFSAAERSALCAAFPEHTVWDEPSMFFGGVHLCRLDAKGNLAAAGDPRRDGASITL